MNTRQARAESHWIRAEVPQGDPRMSPHLWCMLVLFLCSCSKEMVVLDKTRPARHSYQMQNGQNLIRNLKRHSDGTFSSDFTHYLDKIKAKDFVEWLASTKREGPISGDLLFKAGEQDDRFQPWAKTGSCKIPDRCHQDLLQMAAHV